MCEHCRRREDADRALWMTFRRALLMIAKAIQVRYAGDGDTTQERRAA